LVEGTPSDVMASRIGETRRALSLRARRIGVEVMASGPDRAKQDSVWPLARPPVRRQQAATDLRPGFDVG